MVELEIKKISKYLQVPAGKLTYSDDNIIQMKAGSEKIVGFSSIMNYFHKIIEKENKSSENYFLTKQFFDFANLFIRSTSKKDKCKLFKSPVMFRSHFSLIFSYRCCMPRAQPLSRNQILLSRTKHFAR